MRRAAVLVGAGLLLAGLACGLGPRQVAGPRPPEPELDAAARAEIRALRDRLAEGDLRARRELGMTLMWLTLSGHLSLQAEAETTLEAALRADPGDKVLARALGRFYNMRTVAGDVSKAREQVWAYDLLLGPAAADPDGLTHRGFVAWTFARMGQALVHVQSRRLGRALRVVHDLERALQRRTAKQPGNVELRALAGNFALFFAGNLPAGKRRRTREAAEHFTYVRQHWDELRAGAKDPVHCPNTYENFMFELAEARLALGERAEAAEIYRELATPRAPAPPAREQIAQVAAGRLSQLDDLAGDLRLMPPWPSDADNCVVCHASRARVSLRTLHRAP